MDRRQNKTQLGIKAVFIHLLSKNPIDKITVSRISELADINRGTFYLHYHDVYDLHDQIVAELITDMTTIFSTTYPTTTENYSSFKTLSYQLVNYIATHQATVDVLLNQQQVGAVVFKKVKTTFIQKALILETDLSDSVPDKIEINFIVSGIMGLIIDFISHELPITAEELYQHIYNLLLKF
ncbi:TetR/AcrR family transcriptional regulator [Leuconostoc inhae]|uniref:TetR/AcrR family transcriptional regulator n=1 Tax=Leuconostoc inhae TaxID=178001 RepID=UPI001C7D3137|nr:TetR/AcrR family transcriptional regulator [Leuconostoc inhae]